MKCSLRDSVTDLIEAAGTKRYPTLVPHPLAYHLVKPILDAMKGVLYQDDRQIVQVESIAIELATAGRIRNTTAAIATGLAAGTDFVLVRVAPAKPVEELL